MSLKQQSIKGFFWAVSQQFSGQILGFVVSLILARILMPEEFGLIGMILVVISLGNFLSESGMSQSLIRTTDPSTEDYSTVFFINLLFGLIIYFLIYILAPFVAIFYEEEVLTSLLRVLSLSIVFNCISIVQKAILTKAINFKTQFKIQLPSIVLSGILGIVFALNGYGVWSLVIMHVSRNGFAAIQFWLYSSWVPSFVFKRSKFKEHLNFGYKLTISGLINTLYNNMYNVIIGKFFSTTDLGFYTRANSTKQLPVNNISNAISRVTYPLFAELKNDEIKLRNAFKRVTQQVSFILTPMLILGIVLADSLFRFAFTEKWMPAVPMFQILCVVGIMYPINSFNLHILNVKGRSDLFLKVELIKKSYSVICVLLLIPFGIYALLLFQILDAILAYIINSYYSGSFLNFSLIDQVKVLAPIFLLSLIMGILCFVINVYVFPLDLNDLMRIVLITPLGLLFYFIAAKLLGIEALLDLLKILKRK